MRSINGFAGLRPYCICSVDVDVRMTGQGATFAEPEVSDNENIKANVAQICGLKRNERCRFGIVTSFREDFRVDNAIPFAGSSNEWLQL